MARKKDSSLADIAQSEGQLETLKKLRDVLSESIDMADNPRDIAPLSRQLTDVLEKIDALENKKPDKHKETNLYVIRQRAANRSAGAKNKACS